MPDLQRVSTGDDHLATTVASARRPTSKVLTVKKKQQSTITATEQDALVADANLIVMRLGFGPLCPCSVLELARARLQSISS
jgi:hypothetical protein